MNKERMQYVFNRQKYFSEQNSECNNTQRGKYTQKTMNSRPCSRPESSTGIKTVSVICH